VWNNNDCNYLLCNNFFCDNSRYTALCMPFGSLNTVLGCIIIIMYQLSNVVLVDYFKLSTNLWWESMVNLLEIQGLAIWKIHFHQNIIFWRRLQKSFLVRTQTKNNFISKLARKTKMISKNFRMNLCGVFARRLSILNFE
jgi:hypothetical protein